MILVYTAFTDGYDALRPLPKLPGVRYVAFSDRQFVDPLWEFEPLATVSDAHWNPGAIRTRQPKLEGVDGYSRTVWLDANVEVDLQGLLDETEAPGIYAAPHYSRRCIYDEAEVVLQKRLANPAQVAAQVEAYRAAGYPRGNGLAMGRVIVRHGLGEFSRAWWAEYLRYPTRDQLSLNYTAWRLGVPINYLHTAVKTHPHLVSRKQFPKET